MTPIRLFVGFDKREAEGFNAFVQSLIATSRNYALMPLCGDQGDGTNAFTYERFRIPELCNWSGPAIYMDGCDMLLRAPLEELAALYDHRYAVQVVKHEYRTKHKRKYIGTPMEAENRDYERKNWSSVILWNCGHREHFKAREMLRGTDGTYLHRFGWLEDDEIGGLPAEWNVLVGEQPANHEAKLVHFTLGIPAFDAYKTCDFADEWRAVNA